MQDLEFLKRSIYAAFEKMLDESLAAVQPEHCVLLMDQRTAGELAESLEIKTYLLGMKYWEFPNDNTKKIPVSLYGFPVEIVRNFEVFPDGQKRHVIWRPLLFLRCPIPNYPISYTCQIALE